MARGQQPPPINPPNYVSITTNFESKTHVTRIITVHGDLIAYSSAVDIKKNRDLAALISNKWKEVDKQLKDSTGRPKFSWDNLS
jgi:hypothetical protein